MSPFDQGQQNLVVFFYFTETYSHLGLVSALLRTQVFLISRSLRKIQQNWGFEPPAMGKSWIKHASIFFCQAFYLLLKMRSGQSPNTCGQRRGGWKIFPHDVNTPFVVIFQTNTISE